MSDDRPPGRPTKYDPSYCGQILDVMGQGYSITAFAGIIGVARSTIHEWMDAYPEFSDAVKVAKAKRTAFLEGRLMREDMPGPAMTGTIFALKNAAPDEWRDKQEIAHSGSLPSLKVEIIRPDADS